ncbi:DUF1801 domain-containing protein [Kaistia terrae]|uniref:DUF1801 domain-containing protein n=1 Tax=Kaistia terrae TaxID=537017 RepID=A0ABW0Q4D9_9HYPH|nr:DUF1801 domain-containing protein [Kaistia terrae]MCX5581146.1 DUF1801 domain-containing protein [Kaistia terrae]
MRDQRGAPPVPDAVASAFAGFSGPTRSRLLRIRQLIFEVAETTPGVGPLTETLKWGEPAYLTNASRSGSTIRLGVVKTPPDTAAILFNCRTTLVESFRAHFPDVFAYQGNRAILVPTSAPLNEQALAICLAMALTYHHRARSSALSSGQ